MSTKSLAPAARTFVLVGSTAKAGSFWAFCGCWSVGLASVTKASVACVAAGDAEVVPPANIPTSARMDAMLTSSLLMTVLPLVEGLKRALEAVTDRSGCQTALDPPRPTIATLANNGLLRGVARRGDILTCAAPGPGSDWVAPIV